MEEKGTHAEFLKAPLWNLSRFTDVPDWDF
jgi:hypothetical protein